MSTAQKFMFETVFGDADEPVETEQLTPEEPADGENEQEEIVPTFSQEDIETARREGFQTGKEEGLNASLDSIERQISATLGNLENQITRIIDGQTAANETTSHLALSVAISVARKMLPEMASRNAINEIELVIKDVLPRLIDEPRITIRLHANVEAGITEHLEALTKRLGYHGAIAVHPDSDIAIGDCRLEWSCGGADRNNKALWRNIDDIISRNVHKPLETEFEDTGEPSAPDDTAAVPTNTTEAQIDTETGTPAESTEAQVPLSGTETRTENTDDSTDPEPPLTTDV